MSAGAGSRLSCKRRTNNTDQSQEAPAQDFDDVFQDAGTVFRLPKKLRTDKPSTSSNKSSTSNKLSTVSNKPSTSSRPRGRPKKTNTSAGSQRNSRSSQSLKINLANSQTEKEDGLSSRVHSPDTRSQKKSRKREDGPSSRMQAPDVCGQEESRDGNEEEDDSCTILVEIEKSLCSDDEKLCPCCKVIVPTVLFTDHFKECLQKFRLCKRGNTIMCEKQEDHGEGRGQGEDEQQQQGGDPASVLHCPVCMKSFKSRVQRISHMKSCAHGYGLSVEQLLLATRLMEKQAEERSELGLPVVDLHHVDKDRRNSAGEKIGKAKLSRKRTKENEDPDVVMALALSRSLAEKEAQSRAETEEKLLALGLGHIVDEDRRMLPVLRPSAAPDPPKTSKNKSRDRGKKYISSTLMVRSKEERERLISEKVAVLLAGEEHSDFGRFSPTASQGARGNRRLARYTDKTCSLWEASHSSSDRPLHQFYVSELSPYIKPQDVAVGGLLRRLSLIPGRLNLTSLQDTEDESCDSEVEGDETTVVDGYCTQLALAGLLGSQEVLDMTAADVADPKPDQHLLDSQSDTTLQAGQGFWHLGSPGKEGPPQPGASDTGGMCGVRTSGNPLDGGNISDCEENNAQHLTCTTNTDVQNQGDGGSTKQTVEFNASNGEKLKSNEAVTGRARNIVDDVSPQMTRAILKRPQQKLYENVERNAGTKHSRSQEKVGIDKTPNHSDSEDGHSDCEVIEIVVRSTGEDAMTTAKSSTELYEPSVSSEKQEQPQVDMAGMNSHHEDDNANISGGTRVSGGTQLFSRDLDISRHSEDSHTTQIFTENIDANVPGNSGNSDTTQVFSDNVDAIISGNKGNLDITQVFVDNIANISGNSGNCDTTQVFSDNVDANISGNSGKSDTTQVFTDNVDANISGNSGNSDTTQSFVDNFDANISVCSGDSHATQVFTDEQDVISSPVVMVREGSSSNTGKKEAPSCKTGSEAQCRESGRSGGHSLNNVARDGTCLKNLQNMNMSSGEDEILASIPGSQSRLSGSTFVKATVHGGYPNTPKRMCEENSKGSLSIREKRFIDDGNEEEQKRKDESGNKERQSRGEDGNGGSIEPNSGIDEETVLYERISQHQVANRAMLDKLSDAWGGLLARGEHCDITLTTSEGSTQSAHSLVLLARCPKLYKEAVDAKMQVRWDEVTKEAAHAFLFYLYTGTCKVKVKGDPLLMDMFDLALQYCCNDLVNYLKALLKNDTAAVNRPSSKIAMTPEKTALEREEGSCGQHSGVRRTSMCPFFPHLAMLDEVTIHQTTPPHETSPLAHYNRGEKMNEFRGSQSPDLFDMSDKNCSFISTPATSPAVVAYVHTPQRECESVLPQQDFQTPCISDTSTRKVSNKVQHLSCHLPPSHTEVYNKVTQHEQQSGQQTLAQEAVENEAATPEVSDEVENKGSSSPLGDDEVVNKGSSSPLGGDEVENKGSSPLDGEDVNKRSSSPPLKGNGEDVNRRSSSPPLEDKGGYDMIDLTLSSDTDASNSATNAVEQCGTSEGLEAEHNSTFLTLKDSYLTEDQGKENVSHGDRVLPDILEEPECDEDMEEHISSVWDDYDDMACPMIVPFNFSPTPVKSKKLRDDNVEMDPVEDKFEKVKSPEKRTPIFRLNLACESPSKPQSTPEFKSPVKSSSSLKAGTRTSLILEGDATPVGVTGPGDSTLAEAAAELDCSLVLGEFELEEELCREEEWDQRKSQTVGEAAEDLMTPQRKKGRVNITVTPMPEYKTMTTPKLKKELEKFGVRPISRRKAVMLLQHLYDQTHPQVTDSEADTTFSETPQRNLPQKDSVDVAKKDQVQKAVKNIAESSAASRKNTTSERDRAGGEGKNKRIQGSAKGKRKKPQGSSERKSKRMRGSMEEGKSNREKESVEEERESDQLNSSQTSTTSTDSSGVECFEETLALGDHDDAITQTQQGSLVSRVSKFITSDPQLHQKVLLYQPFFIEELQASLKMNGVKCNMSSLMDVLDEQCITFRTQAGQKNRSRARKSPKKRKRKSPTKTKKSINSEKHPS